METAQRLRSPELDRAEALSRLAGRDEFFELVRLLEHGRRRESGGLLGSDCPPAAEPVRFHGAHHLGFAARAVERSWCEEGEGGPRHHLQVALLGLTGATGSLPKHYAGLIRERLRLKDTALADFLDLFNHRLLALYYRAWAKYRPALQLENHEHSPLSRLVQALAGQPPQRRDDFPLYYAGPFSRASRSAESLRCMLADYLAHPVAVESFIGQWLPIEDRDRAVLGRRGRNNRLGDGLLTGRRAWDVQSKIRLVIGPLPEAEFERLRPDGERYARLRWLLLQYLPGHLDVELRFLVLRDPGGRPGRSLRLGWNAWLGSREHLLYRATVQLRRAPSISQGN